MMKVLWNVFAIFVAVFFVILATIAWVFEAVARFLSAIIEVLDLFMKRLEHRVHKVPRNTYINCPFKTTYRETFFKYFNATLR